MPGMSAAGVAVLFEAKVLSDISCRIEYDATRNQIARTIDVMLECNAGFTDDDDLLGECRPDWSFFVAGNSGPTRNTPPPGRPAAAASPRYAPQS